MTHRTRNYYTGALGERGGKSNCYLRVLRELLCKYQNGRIPEVMSITRITLHSHLSQDLNAPAQAPFSITGTREPSFVIAITDVLSSEIMQSRCTLL